MRAAALAALAALFLAPAAGAETEPGSPPRLVLLIVVDQLRPDRIAPELPGGIGRLLREGRVFVDAAHDHALTETCPGHGVLLTGVHPGRLGVSANEVFDREANETRYCVEDPAEDARTLGGGPGRSPRSLRHAALGDWLKAAHPGARVFALAGKDRAAVTLGGRRPDGAYWLSPADPPRFTTSRYYRAEAPAWLRRFNGDAQGAQPLLARVPELWRHGPVSGPGPTRTDDYAFEDDTFGRTSGHPVRTRSGDTPALWFTPFADELTLDLARLLIHEKRLGRDATPDLLALSFSATDWIGHRYGPESQEAAAAVRRLDAMLGELLSWLEQEIGRLHLLVALTADHGVLPIPEWLAETGRSECPVPGGRADANAIGRALEAELDARFGSDEADAAGPWLRVAGSELLANAERARAEGVESQAVLEEAKRFLEAQPAIRRVWTRSELAEGSGPRPFAALYRHSFDPERSGDLVVQPERDCLVSRYPAGTSHGSPYRYDRAVPLVIWGAGVEPGPVRGRARPVDLAPTLAARLGLTPPSDLDGRALALSGEGLLEPSPPPSPTSP